jgi:hypothetical protein
MTEVTALIARIVLRYVAGALVAWGLLAPEDADILTMDPEMAVLVGALITAAVEGGYALAKRYGWAT